MILLYLNVNVSGKFTLKLVWLKAEEEKKKKEKRGSLKPLHEKDQELFRMSFVKTFLGFEALKDNICQIFEKESEGERERS